MRISSITIEPIEIPFKLSFTHTSATRSITDSVLVRVYSQDNVGYGESCPRQYVTQETYQTVDDFFHQHQASIVAAIENVTSLKNWASCNYQEIDRNPAAWCAIELALLDLMAKETNSTVEKLLALPELSGSYSYTAVLGNSSIEGFSKLFGRYQSMGFKDYKIKLSGDIKHDKAKCDLINTKVHDARIRLDANNLWEKPEDVINYIKALHHSIFAIEEPLQVNNYGGLSVISDHLDIKVILDESFLRSQQFTYLGDNPDNWIINIRISKMGGLLRSLDIINKAKQLGIDCIVGAQVGETTILTRAALTLVNAFRTSVLAQEGACGTYLLKYDICEPVLMFSEGGEIRQNQLHNLAQSGFGLKIL